MKKTILPFFVAAILVSCKKENYAVADLKLNLPKDFEQSVIYEADVSTNSQMTLNEVNVVNYKVDSVAKNGDYYMTGKLKRANVNQSILGDSFSVDTRESGNGDSDLGSDIQNLVNKEFSFRINAYGRIIEKPKFKNIDADPFLIEQYNILPFALPERKLIEKLTWEETTTNPIDKTVELKTTYTIKKIDSKSIDVSSLGLMGYNGGSDKYRAEIIGSYVLDRKTGLLISGEKSLKMKETGEMTFKISPQMKGFE